MHKLYSMCILSVTLSVGYVHNAKAAPYRAECGLVKSHKTSRIFNGNIAGTGQFPWIASIRLGEMHKCGGTIISDRYILSAAHCFNDSEDKSYSNWTIVLGAHNLTENETFSTIHEISNIIIHEKYSNVNRLLKNDIALIELRDSIKWTNSIQPICLPSMNVERSDNAVAAGWGADLFGTREENVQLRFVEIDIFKNEECNDMYKNKHLGISLEKIHICAGKIGETRDTTKGDSGGPLSVKVDGREVLVGITSFGTNESIYPKCPAIYTRVFEYNDWIMQNINDISYYPPV